jgi:flagellar biosynthesis/type III secretory pathway protein FliH
VLAVVASAVALSMFLTRGTSDAEVARLREISRAAGYDNGLAEAEERMSVELKRATASAREAGRRQGYRDGMAEGQNLGHKKGYSEGEAAGYESGAQAGYETGYSDGFADGQMVQPEMSDEERLGSYMAVLDCLMDPNVPRYLCSQID